MGVCTSKANRRVQESGKRNTNRPANPNSNPFNNHKSNNNKSSKQRKYSTNISDDITSTKSDDEHLNNIILDQIRNAPDDPGFVLMSDLRESTNNNGNNNNNDIWDYGKSCTSNSFMMISPTNQFSTEPIDDDEITTPICSPCNDYIDDDETLYIRDEHIMTIGDEIELIGKYGSLHGVIRFIGEIIGRNGIFYGIESCKSIGTDDVWIYWRKRINADNGFDIDQYNGYIDNICYFECNDNEGLFVKKGEIGRILKVNYDNPRVSINDEISISRYKCNGIIRYIGKPQFKNDENLHDTYYGIELKQFVNEGHDGIFHDQCYFSNCNKGYGVFLKSSDKELMDFIVPSRFNLLIHGYFDKMSKEITISNATGNIPSGIIKLIKSYSNTLEMRLTSIPNGIGETIRNNNIICKRYELFDINNNICGPSINLKYTGSNTQCSESETVISGYYKFIKSSAYDTGDYHIKWVKKTEFQIIKFSNGDTQRIYRSIESDNEQPLLIDYKSIRMRFRHDIHLNDIDECDHNKVLNHIANLYGLLPHEILKTFKTKGIQLYGLTI